MGREKQGKNSEIDKSKIEKNRGDKRGFGPLQSMGSGRIESSFSDLSISSNGAGFGNGSGFGLNSKVYSFSIKREARPPSFATFPGLKRCKSRRTNLFVPKSRRTNLFVPKSRRTNQCLESLKAGQSRSAAPPLTDPITLTVEEKINVTLKRNGGVSKFDVQGTLSLQILNEEDGNIQLHVQTGENQAISFKYEELFSNESVLGLKDPNWPFPTGQANDIAGVNLLKWRVQSTDVSMVPLAINTDESMVPLTIKCWPSTSGNVIGQNETYVSIEYEASSMFDLRNVVISVPLPALLEEPSVKQVDGKWRYDSRNSVLEWSVLLIDNSNRSGLMEFVVPEADSSAFFPISVRFMATETFSDLKVTNIIPLKGVNPPKFSQRIQLITENYQVV